MIEINLLPGSAKRQKQRLPAFSAGPLANLKLPKLDKTTGYLALAWVVGVALLAWLHFGSTGKLNKLQLDVAAAQRDSVRLNRQRVLNDSLNKQISEVGARLEVLQEIDAGRYIWAHIMDEISRALPQYTWLINVTDAAGEDKEPAFKIEGRTGNTFALAKFMQDMEASPFLRNVEIISQTETEENNKRLYAFVLEVQYEEPSPDAIETRPLFGPSGEIADETGAPDSAATVAAPAPRKVPVTPAAARPARGQED